MPCSAMSLCQMHQLTMRLNEQEQRMAWHCIEMLFNTFDRERYKFTWSILIMLLDVLNLMIQLSVKKKKKMIYFLFVDFVKNNSISL